ncbi:MAG: AAA family ATPase [Bacteroidales bacterium]|nr:AAA family ATPase [Bacteroidales bacterium]
MLKRKITPQIEAFMRNPGNKMLVVDGARQVGKSFLIRELGTKLFPNYIEINMEEDKQHDRIFAEAKSVNSFYFALSSIAGNKMGAKSDTLVFIDEIQAYAHLLTLSKFLLQEDRFTYIASGSLLGVTLRKTQSVPVGSIEQLHMYPLDFEEFLWANSMGEYAIGEMKRRFEQGESLDESIHNKLMELFKRYLLVGGLPEVVNSYITEHNIYKVRLLQTAVMDLYKADAAKYETEAVKKLKIQRIYSMIPTNMGNLKKRFVMKDIEGKKSSRTSDYIEEFEYLVSAGIAIEVDAISQPTYPLVQNAGKNLLKLYLNDVGLLTNILYGQNIKPVLDDVDSVNLGAVYETVVAQELKCHGYNLFYYDNKKIGEVDFLIDDTMAMSSLPLEVKSGKDYEVHKALDRFLSIPDYHVASAFVLCNQREITLRDKIRYVPVYMTMFLKKDIEIPDSDLRF